MMQTSRQYGGMMVAAVRSGGGLQRFATLSHVSADGTKPRMVDVGDKGVTARSATARCIVKLPQAVLDAFKTIDGQGLNGPKGPVFTTAIIAGVQGAKKTSELIPFCHPLPIEACDVDIKLKDSKVIIEATVKTTHKTGVEMEALTACSVAALCVYDMCKAVSHDIVIEESKLLAKSGGKRIVDKRSQEPA